MRALAPILKCRDDILAVKEAFLIQAIVRSSTGHYARYSTEVTPSSTVFKEMYDAILDTVGHEYGVLTGQFITREEWKNLYRDDDHLGVPIHATWIRDYSRRFIEVEKVTLLFNLPAITSSSASLTGMLSPLSSGCSFGILQLVYLTDYPQMY